VTASAAAAAAAADHEDYIHSADDAVFLPGLLFVGESAALLETWWMNVMKVLGMGRPCGFDGEVSLG